MIVRILGEGQLQVDDSLTGELNELDALLGRVRLAGTPVPADMLAPSDLIMPQADATRDDVRKLMTDDGLIPG